MQSAFAEAKKRHAHRMDTAEASSAPESSILDLPELALECILEKLPPSGLSNMSKACSSLRERCRSDYFWEKHMRGRWGRVIGPAAEREWKLHSEASRKGNAAGGRGIAGHGKHNRWTGVISCVWPISWIKAKVQSSSSNSNIGRNKSSPLPDDYYSIMSWYRSLESGSFWFPAQVYNRENGHVGFMLSCYDAEVCYDCHTDTFQARYSPHGRRTVVIEEGVTWDRLRAPPVDTPAHDLHISDCLTDLHPGDHIEIQWRRNKDFPYGWWYGVVGHLESCDGNAHFCRCHLSNTAVLEFNQYTPGSRWRRALINRSNHREEGSETDGFYGGIRKLRNAKEISKWKQLWPSDALE